MKKRAYSDITILVDIDDTIENLLDAWCKWLNDKYCLSVKPEIVIDWDVAKFFPTLNKEQVFEPLHRDDFWYTVEPKEDASKYLQMLIQKGFNLFLCTSTDYRNVKPKYEANILQHFPFIHWNRIIVAYNKQMIKAAFLIDDGVHNQEGGDYIKILVSASHNQTYNAEQNGMIRANDWKFIYDNTSARTMNAVEVTTKRPNKILRRVFKAKDKVKRQYKTVSGTRRCTLRDYEGGWYGSNAFRESYHNFFKDKGITDALLLYQLL